MAEERDGKAGAYDALICDVCFRVSDATAECDDCAMQVCDKCGYRAQVSGHVLVLCVACFNCLQKEEPIEEDENAAPESEEHEGESEEDGTETDTQARAFTPRKE